MLAVGLEHTELDGLGRLDQVGAHGLDVAERLDLLDAGVGGERQAVLGQQADRQPAGRQLLELATGVGQGIGQVDGGRS